MSVQDLITEHLDLWTGAITKKSSSGRGNSGKIELTGVKKLRELILELAVRGKLTQQNSDHKSAKIHLQQIAAEKAHLVNAGVLKTDKKSKPIADSDYLFELPKSWEFCRLSDIGYISNGNSISKVDKETKYAKLDSGVPYIATKDVGYGFTALNYDNGILVPLNEKFKIAPPGSILICSEGGSAGKKCGITTQEISFGNKLYALQPFAGTYSQFILSFYLTPTFQNQFQERMTGIIGGISLSKFQSIILPMPPLEEQRVIVQKVDELMALCDRMEQQTSDQLEAHETLVDTLLGTLTQSENATELADNWARLAAHFDTLFTTEQSIDKFKQTILQLAVMGRLAQHERKKLGMNSLLQEIKLSRQNLIEQGELKRQKKLPEISDEEKTHLIPDSWEWARLQDVIDVRDGTHDSPKNATGPNTYPLITSKDFRDSQIDFSNAKRISAEDHRLISQRSLVEPGDILFSMIGGNIGNQVLVNTSEKFSIKNVALFKYYDKNLTIPRFLKIFTEDLANTLQSQASGGAQPFVSLGKLRNLPFPLPPVKEQHRIVHKVDELMALCDRLKERLSQANDTRCKLADAIVDKAVN